MCPSRPNVCALDDRSGWGREIFKECIRRGWETNLFHSASELMQFEPKADYAFMRLDPHAKRLAKERQQMKQLIDAQYRVIPGWETGRLYSDKVAQAEVYREWMPKTWVLTAPETATATLASLPIPFLSKSRVGGATANVRLIERREQAEAEIHAVFNGGMRVPCKSGEPIQQGYLLWSEVLPEVPHDYHVVATGRMRMILRCRNHHRPLAPGAGWNEPVEELDDETRSVLAFADAFFKKHGLNWCGIDVVWDSVSNGWRLLEATLDWKQSDYARCQYFNSDGEPEQYVGAEIWRLLCDEIEENVFG